MSQEFWTFYYHFISNQPTAQNKAKLNKAPNEFGFAEGDGMAIELFIQEEILCHCPDA